MPEVKPWEELPDDEYWRALLGDPSPGAPKLDADSSPQRPAVVPRNGNGEQPFVPPPPLHTVPAFNGGGWALAEKSYTQGDTLELRVIGYNRGGVLVDLGEIHGFVPASQLTSFPRKVQEDERMQELGRYVNTTLRLKVIEFDRLRNRLILSERIANPAIPRADQVLATLVPHQARQGDHSQYYADFRRVRRSGWRRRV